MLTPLMTQDDQALLIAAVQQAPDDAVIVEFGCGGSTCLLGQTLRADQRLISVEHTHEWHQRVTDAVRDLPVTVVYRPVSYPALQPYGHPHEECPVGMDDYIHVTDTDIPWERVAVVLVDGIARGAVLATVRLKLRDGATVFVHDYKGREDWYNWAVSLYPHYQPPSGSSLAPDGRRYDNSLMTLSMPRPEAFGFINTSR